MAAEKSLNFHFSALKERALFYGEYSVLHTVKLIDRIFIKGCLWKESRGSHSGCHTVFRKHL